MTIVSQRDSKWSGVKLGTSSVTIGSHGCTITALGYLVGLTPDKVNERLIAVSGYANTNLVIWSKVAEAIGVACYRYTTYNNDLVKEAIEKNGAVLGEVDAQAIGGTGKHWVVMIGSGKVQDPWFGEERPTSNYNFTGYTVAVFDKSKLGNYQVEPVVDPCLNYKKELDEKREHISNLEQQVAGLLGEKKQLLLQIDELKGEMGSVRGDLATSLSKIEGLNNSLATYQKEDAVQLDTIRTYEREKDEYRDAILSALDKLSEITKVSRGSDTAVVEFTRQIEALQSLLLENKMAKYQSLQLKSDVETLIGRNEELIKEIAKLKAQKKSIDKMSTKQITLYLLQRMLKRS